MGFRTTLPALILALAAAPALAQPVATVNGETISEEQLNEFLAEREVQSEQLTPEQRTQVIEQLVARELLLQDAGKHKLEESPRVQQNLAELKEELLIGAAVERALEENPVTEEQMRAEYKKQAPELRQQEFKARHILLNEQAEAEKLIEELNRGADFQQLAREHSTGPSAPEGGDLGWFTADRMVPPFADAVRSMQPGTYTKSPVQTQFGWHVILLEETRTTEPPPYEALKPQLEQLIQRQNVAEYIHNLRQQAKVEIK